MDLFEAITRRRSFRKYTDEPVKDEELERCLDAARWAPSWANTQCTRFVVVKDKDTRAKIAGLLSEKNPARHAVEDAPLVVVFAARLGESGFIKGERTDDKEWYMFDAGLSMQNFCLAAHALGLGTVIVGLMDYKGIENLLGLDENFQVVALTPLGRPDGGDRPPARKEIPELRHDGSWDSSKA